MSAAATIAVGSFFAPATTSAVWPSREIETPAAVARRVEMRESERRIASAFATVARKAGELVVSVAEWMTTIGAELERPPKFRWISVARLHRLGAVRLPARAGKRRLDLRREHGQRDRNHRPGDRDDPDVVCRPAAQTADRADGLRVLDRGGNDNSGCFGNCHSRLLSRYQPRQYTLLYNYTVC